MTEEGGGREWFREWFGEEYLALYPHRDEEEAAEAVRLFLATTGASAKRGRVLDVACGEGRHLRELLAAGVAAVGLDLSNPLLNRARKADPKSRLVRGDMRRLPIAAGSFAGLTSFFTSFGYFADRDEDREVAAEFRRVLAPGGRFMLDFLNAGRVRRELVPRDERTLRGHRVTQERRVDNDTVWKRITIEDVSGKRAPRTFVERVRLYRPAELEEILGEQGLVTLQRFGDYAGGAFEEKAPRLILCGRAV